VREIKLRRRPNLTVDSVYFGGGTPSLMPPTFYMQVMAALAEAFDLQDDIEITLEANPGTIDQVKLAAFRQAGVNRLNLGIQSFDDQNLQFLGRIHSATQARVAIAWARRAGFDNLGLDLIYGLPGQTVEGWQADLKQALSHAPEHLSCYALTYENNTPLLQDRLKGGHQPADEAEIAVLFDATADVLGAAGFDHYEISNFAADPRWQSRHNTKYWTRAPYVGLGVAAHSFRTTRRSWNTADLDVYIQRLAQGRLPKGGHEALNAHQQMIEAVFLGLRRSAGIDLAAFAQCFATPLETRAAQVLPGLVADGFLRQSKARLRPTRKGMRLHDSISAMLAGVL
jgi:oxygen-independent coproporphyrinogen-3 oxidase